MVTCVFINSVIHRKFPVQKLRVFLFSYSHAGSQYSLEIPAYTAEEARERVAKLAYAKYDGELAYKIPAITGASVFVRLLTWFKNKA